MNRFWIPILLVTSLTACAAIVTGQNQSISVNTIPKEGAKCTLTNDKGTWYVPSTPGSVTVSRAYGALMASCEKGEWRGIIAVNSATKGMAFGNVLAGGIIGGAVDMGTGAAYDYPQTITVELINWKKYDKK